MGQIEQPWVSICLMKKIFPYFLMKTFSALTLLVERQEKHPACKN